MFGVRAGKLLGYMVLEAGINPNPTKIQTILEMEPPKSIRELQMFIGRIAALGRFIVRLAEKSMPFFETLRSPRVFKWTEEHQVAFEQLKEYLVELPTLNQPPSKAQLLLYVAAAPNAVSGVLVYQVKEDKGAKEMLVYYVSETLTGARCKYGIVEKLL